MNPGVSIAGLVCCAGGAGVLYAARSGARRLREFEQTRIADLARVAEGALVRLSASVACDEPLEDPVSGDPCVYSRVSVFESAGLGLGNGSRNSDNPPVLLHETLERAPRWSLEDETGAIEVDCEDFVVEGGPAGDSERALRYYALSGWQYSGTSCRIPVGHRVLVEGRLARRDDGALALTGPKLTVDGRSAGRHSISVQGFYVLAALLLIAGLAVVASGFVSPEEAPAPQVREGPLRKLPARRP